MQERVSPDGGDRPRPGGLAPQTSGTSEVTLDQTSEAAFGTGRTVNNSTAPRGYSDPFLASRDEQRVRQNWASKSGRTRNRNRGWKPAKNQNLPQVMKVPEGISPYWQLWSEVSVRITGLPRTCMQTLDIYERFSAYGPVNFIKLENLVAGTALVIYGIPPQIPFWNQEITFDTASGEAQRVGVQLLTPEANKRCPSPVDHKKMFPHCIHLPACSITFGLMRSKDVMLAMHTSIEPLILSLNLFDRKRLELSFRVDEVNTAVYRAQIPLQTIVSIIEVNEVDCFSSLVITVENPPKFFVRKRNIAETHSRRHEWKEWPRAFERQTDIDYKSALRNNEPVSLVRSDPVIDLGRWLTYKIDFKSQNFLHGQFREALRDHNISIVKSEDFRTEKLPRSQIIAPVWKYLDPNNAGHPSDLHQMQDDMLHLDFALRYQLEVCISHGKINEYNMNKDFISFLSKLNGKNARMLLENVAESDRVYHKPMEIFSASELRSSRNLQPKPGCVVMHSVTLTPTTMLVHTPASEPSNRVIRENAGNEDRFLRVRFQDEAFYGKIWSNNEEPREEVFRRIDRAFKNGIDVAGRHYELLAWSNSQFREHAAVFFARTSNQTAEGIRRSLGQLDHINVIAKYAARIGQCFSTTKRINTIRTFQTVLIPDVEVGDYIFTDGVGKISPFAAQMIANEFRDKSATSDYPSVYQFRMDGSKGVLAVDPTIGKGPIIHIRHSQQKFTTTAEKGLEVVRSSRFVASCLNQQMILILRARGVPKQLFVDKMTEELRAIDLAMKDEKTALARLQRNVDFNHVTIQMATMILDGFMKSKDPFLMSLLRLWRAWSLKNLKEKAKIMVDQGAFVFGVTDETKTLRMDPGALPEIFIQVPDSSSKTGYRAIEDICILGRNPSLHPGDLRVVQAVDCKALHHLKNCVVFPQQGTRDLANMCSGGDLDGDDYLVMWDKSLIPPESEWDESPMDYTALEPKCAQGQVTNEQLHELFITNMKLDNLPTIALNHRAMADRYEEEGGVKHAKCRRLAYLHSIAVDFAKTGQAAVIDEDLRPQLWPHWMESKPDRKKYRSEGVLGQLYDRVKLEEFRPFYNQSFDSRILNAYDVDEEKLQSVAAVKKEYDADMKRIMAQHGIRTEFEAWTSFVMRHNREKSDYSFAEEMGRLTGSLKLYYHDRICALAGTDKVCKDFEKLGPFVVAMYKLTASEVEEARHSSPSIMGDNSSPDDLGDLEEVGVTLRMPLISFPWIFADELGRVARKDVVRPRAMQRVGPRISDQESDMKTAMELTMRTADSLAKLEPLPEVNFSSIDGPDASGAEPVRTHPSPSNACVSAASGEPLAKQMLSSQGERDGTHIAPDMEISARNSTLDQPLPKENVANVEQAKESLQVSSSDFLHMLRQTIGPEKEQQEHQSQQHRIEMGEAIADLSAASPTPVMSMTASTPSRLMHDVQDGRVSEKSEPDRVAEGTAMAGDGTIAEGANGKKQEGQGDKLEGDGALHLDEPVQKMDDTTGLEANGENQEGEGEDEKEDGALHLEVTMEEMNGPTGLEAKEEDLKTAVHPKADEAPQMSHFDRLLALIG